MTIVILRRSVTVATRQFFGFNFNLGSNISKETMAGAQSFVDEKLNGKKVVMISKSWCPSCKNAKSVFAKFNLSPDVYEVVDIEDREDCEAIQQYMQKLSGARTVGLRDLYFDEARVPRVFINKECIGGNDDTVRMQRDGSLEKKLKDCGAL